MFIKLLKIAPICAILAVGGGYIVSAETLSVVANQKQECKGKVLDSYGQPVAGASILIKGTKIGTLTDYNGNFSLPQAKKGNILEVSFLGFISQNIPYNGEDLTITLKEDTQQLNEVVVTALGIKRSQKALSYNVQEIKSEAINTVKDANFMNALAGKVAGVNINSSSAGIGGATRVVMRGPKSVNQSNQALYVIDGIPVFNSNKGGVEGIFTTQPRGEGISDINPDDIASISVLSGPAAAALYGAQAAQGVIMITTKKGKEGKVSVNISNNTSFSTPFVMPLFQNTYGNAPGNIKSWGEKLPNGAQSFDPAKFFQTAYNVQNTVALTVGSEKNQTYISVGTTNAEGIIPNSAYDRYNFTVRNTTKFLKDKVTFDFGFNYIKQKDRNLMAQGQYFNPLVPLYLFPRGENFEPVRVFEIWDEDRRIYTQNWNYGDDLKMQNPYWVAHRMVRTDNKDRYMVNASLKYQVLNWLDFTGRVRKDVSKNLFEDKRYASTIDLFAHSPYGFYQYQNEADNSLYADFMANINKNIANFNISANIGVSTNRTDSDVRGYQGGLRKPSNVFTPLQINYANATNDNRPIFYGGEHINNAVFGNLELSYKSMLYLTVTGRTDWDSALAYTTSNPFFYPSVGLSGVVSEMVKLPSWIDFLKVRGSWAKVGSPIPTQISSPYRFTYNPANQNYSTVTYKFPSNFKPELTYSYEAGIQAKFFSNRISVDLTLYQSNTKNQTYKVPISPSGGYNEEYIQAGNIRNRGIELSCGLNNSWGGFDWNSTFTYSANQNKIIELIPDKEDAVISKGGLNGIGVILKKGGTMGDYYTTTALRRGADGDITLDAKGNLGTITLDAPKYVGSVLPKANLGWVNDFNYKGINLGFMFSARIGGIVMSQTQAIMDNFGVSKASALLRESNGVPVNHGYIDAQKFYSVVGGESPIWEQYIYDGTNVRLQEAHLSYTLPAKWIFNKARLTLGITARNLFMIYNKAPFDPELTASTGTYYQGLDYFMQPSLRNFGFNVKLQF